MWNVNYTLVILLNANRASQWRQQEKEQEGGTHTQRPTPLEK